MRGAPCAEVADVATGGIIPAYAGSTPRRCCRRTRRGDHPRVCGEHIHVGGALYVGEGSSPRMRGAPRTGSATGGTRGIIPAYAGSTYRFCAEPGWHRDHPRVCGEHVADASWYDSERGSSPRMRGAHAPWEPAIQLKGIIPAYAGSTGHERDNTCRCGDHPRVCGEHSSPPTAPPTRRGSSPRMRGALALLFGTEIHDGIIPAYAGSTAPRPPSPPSPGDHPRVCGEHTSRAATLFVILMQRDHFLQALAAPPRSFNISQRCPRLYPGSSL